MPLSVEPRGADGLAETDRVGRTNYDGRDRGECGVWRA